MSLNLIVCMDKNGLIGKGNELPWRIPEDLKYFKETTKGKTVVMGRKTWESLPKRPLKDRMNYVLTRDENLVLSKTYEDSWVVNKREVLDTAEFKDIFIIGGSEIYKQFYKHCDRLYITYVDKVYDGDVYFPIPVSQINNDFNVKSRTLGKECEFLIMDKNLS